MNLTLKDKKNSNQDSKIFVISAKAENGKDSTADLMKSYYEMKGKKVLILHYAKYIKQYAKDYFGWDGSDISKPRELLQLMGTDIIRQALNKPNFHVNRIIEDIEILSYFFDVVLIPDTRFPNEIELPREKFGDRVKSIRVTRENFVTSLTKEQQEHLSETALDNYDNFDYRISASNLDELGDKVHKLMLDIEYYGKSN